MDSMNINENSMFIKNHHKRRRNFRNSMSPPTKKSKLNKKKSVTFKNSVKVKNLNISNEAREYRRPVGISKNKEDLANYMTNVGKAQEKMSRIKKHRNETLKKLNNKKD